MIPDDLAATAHVLATTVRWSLILIGIPYLIEWIGGDG